MTQPEGTRIEASRALFFLSLFFGQIFSPYFFNIFFMQRTAIFYFFEILPLNRSNGRLSIH